MEIDSKILVSAATYQLRLKFSNVFGADSFYDFVLQTGLNEALKYTNKLLV